MDWEKATVFPALQQIIEDPRLGLVTALEGTLCPVTDDPAGTHVSPRCREILSGLADKLALVGVISARPATDMRVRVELPNATYAGLRGLEIWENGRMETAPEAAAFRQPLEAAMLALYPHLDMQVKLEDTGAGLLIHYEQIEDFEAAVARIRPVIEEIAQQQGLRLFAGTRVFELRPPMVIDKGSALLQMIERHHLGGIIYIGDDANDVAAFRVVSVLRREGKLRGLIIGVESLGMPDELRAESDLIVEGIAGVETLLAWLLHARTAWADTATSSGPQDDP
jgi:trehalose 6-phosphate phosphatase